MAASAAQQAWTGGPHTVSVPKTEHGFGFTLRHFIVYPPEGATEEESKETEICKDGVSAEDQQRRRGRLSSLEPMDTIFVKHVKQGSPAHVAGLNQGDRIVSVNGESVTGKTYPQVIALIQASDCNLQLLVVPKDEDILQMAYQNSAYNQSPEATEQPPNFSSFARMQQTSYSAIQGKQPVADTPSPQSTSAPLILSGSSSSSIPGELRIEHQGYSSSRTSASSLHSAASHHSGASERSSRSARSQHIDPHYSSQSDGPYGYVDPKHNSAPPAPVRTSSKQITLQHLAVMGERYGSMESVGKSSRSSDSNSVQYTQQDNLLQQIKQDPVRLSSDKIHHDYHGQTASHQPMLSNRMVTKESYDHIDSQSGRSISPNTLNMRAMPRYTKSYTTSILPQYGANSSQPGSDVNHSSHMRNEVTWSSGSLAVATTTITMSTSGPRSSQQARPSHVTTSTVNSYQSAIAYKPVTSGYIPRSERDQDVNRNPYSDMPESRFNYKTQARPGYRGALEQINENISSPDIRNHTGSISIHSNRPTSLDVQRTGNATSIGIKYSRLRTQSDDTRSPSSTHVVLQRAKQFEDTVDSPMTSQVSHVDTDKCRSEFKKLKSKSKVESVASRKAQYEQITSPTSPSPTLVRKSLSGNQYSSPVSSTGSPQNSHQRKTSDSGFSSLNSDKTDAYRPSNMADDTPATVKFYFRQPTNPTRGDYPRPAQSSTQSYKTDQVFFDTDSNIPISGNTEAMKRSDGKVPPPLPARKYSQSETSFLNDSTRWEARQARDRSPHDQPIRKVKGDEGIRRAPPTGNHSSCRRQPSYLNAVHVTANQNDNIHIHVEHRKSNSDVTGRQVMPSFERATPATAKVIMRQRSREDDAQKLVRRTSYLMATAKDYHQSRIKEIPEQPTTPTGKPPSIGKLKSFFGERTPQIMEATNEQRQRSYSTSTLMDQRSLSYDVIKEGAISCKMALADGKKASDRSWKVMWAVLKGHALYLMKERKDVLTSPILTDEQVISIKSCMVDIAYDYTKRKNVFRLKAFNISEYLFHCDSHEDMLAWIKAIQDNNNPDSDMKGVANESLIVRMTHQVENQQVKSSPPVKEPKEKTKIKLSSLSFRAPKNHSPNFKKKFERPSNDDSPKIKDSKTFKDKMMKSFRRFGSAANQTNTGVSDGEVTGTFGVPIDLCRRANTNENIPMVVELCTMIVETRGLEFVGIYRVPGNTAAVTLLQEELNKGIVNAENEKWLDINVVSSLLKSFFRKLPESLVTDELYQQFIDANRLTNLEKRMLKLKRLLHDLPEVNFETFQHLAAHLNRVSQLGHVNKMDSRNLAIVFGPTLVRKTDESMCSMVTDMSDQCRIIESVINHYAWMFDSWDVDFQVPIDGNEGENITPVSGMNDVLTKIAKNEEDDKKEISPRDIMNNIIHAANKKIKKKKASAGDIDTNECGFNERNIDEEVKVRKQKIEKHEQSLKLETVSDVFTTTKATPPKSNKEEASDTNPLMVRSLDSNVLPSNALPSNERKSSAPVLSTFDDSLEKSPEYKQGFQRNFVSIYNNHHRPMPLVRRYSDESLLDRRQDETPISYARFKANQQLKAHERVKKLEIESKALLAKQRERHQMEMNKRENDQSDYSKTKDRYPSNEELLKPSAIAVISDYTNRISDLSAKAETSSITSDYSTTSSTHTLNNDTRGQHSVGPTSDYSSNASPATLPKKVLAGNRSQVSRYTRKNKSRSALDPQTTNNQTPTRTETIFDAQKISGKSTLQRKKRPKECLTYVDTDSGINTLNSEWRYDGKRRGSLDSSMRRGSLDSLRDFYDKNDNRWSYCSSASEDGGDLLRSITATFDQKLRVLLNPKYTLDTQHTQHSSRQTSAIDLPTHVREKMDVGRQRNSIDTIQSLVNGSKYETGLTRSQTDTLFDKFRDPSLHRTQRPEAKIGIASRFERNANTSSPNTSINVSSASLSGSSDRTLSINNEAVPLGQISAIETDSDTSKDSQNDLHHVIKDSPKENKAAYSPPAIRKKKVDMKMRRRHTVGGTQDIDHFKALMSITGANQVTDNETDKKSAWERLHPERQGDSPSDVTEWLEHATRERLRANSQEMLNEQNGISEQPAITVPNKNPHSEFIRNYISSSARYSERPLMKRHVTTVGLVRESNI